MWKAIGRDEKMSQMEQFVLEHTYGRCLFCVHPPGELRC